MSKRIVADFYKALCKSARRKGAGGEKPIFLMATLRYVIEKDALGHSLLDLLLPRNKQKIRRHFLYLADRRLAKPEDSWDKITRVDKKAIKDSIVEYIAEVADVNEAFSELAKKDAQKLLAQFMEELELVPYLSLEDRLT